MSRLKASVDFKKGIGYLYDPETGKRFDQRLVDWKWFGDHEPLHLTFNFEHSDLMYIESDNKEMPT